jgi:hypothetical protein
MIAEFTKPFLFIHIRKTAGVSLRGLLANQFPAGRVLFQAHSVSGPSEPGDANFVTGHVGLDYARRFAAAPTIFTTIREPISRCLSTYHFFRSNDGNHLRTLAIELTNAEHESRCRFTDRARRLGLLEFLVEEESLARAWLSNGQARQLLGGSFAGLAEGADCREIVRTYLAECDVVGIFERLDDTLRLLSHTMNWGRLGPLPHTNKTKLYSADVDPRCIEILRAWNSLDFYLYEEACRLFESKLQAMHDRGLDHAPPDAILAGDRGKVYSGHADPRVWLARTRVSPGQVVMLEFGRHRHSRPSPFEAQIFQLSLPVVPRH